MVGILILVFFSSISEKVDANFCSYYVEKYQYLGRLSCNTECCNSNSFYPCCNYNSYYDNFDYWQNNKILSIGAIAGIVTGCIIGFSVFTTIIVCLCKACRRQNGLFKGQVIARPGLSYVTATSTSGQLNVNPYGENVNSGFMMELTCPAYSIDDNLAPPPYHTVIEHGFPNEEFSYSLENGSAAHSYCSSYLEDDSARHEDTCSTSQTDANICSS